MPLSDAQRGRMKQRFLKLIVAVFVLFSFFLLGCEMFGCGDDTKLMSDEKFFSSYCDELFYCSVEWSDHFNGDTDLCISQGRKEIFDGNYMDLAYTEGHKCLDCLADLLCNDFLLCDWQYDDYNGSTYTSCPACPDCAHMFHPRLSCKPNIYLYPEETTELAVTLSFPRGGAVTVSDPDYGDGWRVIVTPDGIIDDKYGYLFYESLGPDRFQRDAAWRIERDELEPFFRADMADAGFRDREIDDFVDYWLPILDRCPAYNIYPQTDTEIDEHVLVNFSQAPDIFIRYYYVIGCAEGEPTFTTPETHTPVERTGFTALEWGVIPLFDY